MVRNKRGLAGLSSEKTTVPSRAKKYDRLVSASNAEGKTLQNIQCPLYAESVKSSISISDSLSATSRIPLLVQIFVNNEKSDELPPMTALGAVANSIVSKSTQLVLLKEPELL